MFDVMEQNNELEKQGARLHRELAAMDDVKAKVCGLGAGKYAGPGDEDMGSKGGFRSTPLRGVGYGGGFSWRSKELDYTEKLPPSTMPWLN